MSKRAPTIVRSTSDHQAALRGKGGRASKSSSKGLWIGAGIFVVGAVIALVIANSGGGGNSEVPDDEPVEVAPAVLLADALKVLGADKEPSTAQESYDGYEALLRKVDQWVADRVHIDAINGMRKRALELREKTKDLDPDFAAYRNARDEVRYDDRLKPLLEAEYLSDLEKVTVKKVHDSLARIAAKEQGWIPKSEMEKAAEVEKQFEEKTKDHLALTGSPFFAQAQKMIETTVAELDQRMAAVDGLTWEGVEVRIVEPYVFFVQKDSGWDALQVAISRSQELLALQDTIIEEYKDQGLKPVDRPVPVLYFRNHTMYQNYAGNQGSGALAHFEPLTGRMAIHDSSDHTTRQHEGTHQLMWFWTARNPATNLNPGLRSYWFQEGVAEWYSSSNRYVKPDGTYGYKVGLMEAGRMRDFGHMPTKTTIGQGAARPGFNIKELIQTRYADRDRIGTEGRTGYVYSQGWFMIYFLNYFNVTDAGSVVVGANGKYADRYQNYMRAELSGETGLDVFMKHMELDEEGLRKMREEYWRYSAYISNKISLRQVDDRKQLIPWDEYVNKRNEKVGEPKDDLLPPMPDYAPDPWWN
jgi:hypothetical protein